MEPNRIAVLLLAVGGALGLASASLVPTSAVSAPASLPSASAEDYPEITAVSYENIPGPVAPMIRRAPMQLASLEKPWLEPPPFPPETAYPRVEDEAVHDYRSPDEDSDQPYEAELIDEPVEMSITLAGHP